MIHTPLQNVNQIAVDILLQIIDIPTSNDPTSNDPNSADIKCVVDFGKQIRKIIFRWYVCNFYRTLGY